MKFFHSADRRGEDIENFNYEGIHGFFVEFYLGETKPCHPFFQANMDTLMQKSFHNYPRYITYPAVLR